MNNVSQRFEGFLKTTRVEHGELRFEACHDQERWAALVDDCCKAFAAWRTQRLWSQLAKASDGKTVGIAAPDADRNDLELRWCHMFIEPTCYSRLLRELAFDSPDKRLALPRFFMSEKQEKNVDNDSHLGHPAELSEEGLDEIQRRLAARDARRQNIDPHYVTLLIDGMEHKQFDLTEKGQLQVEVDAGASLIEIRGEDDQGDLLLATHVISYAENAFESSGGSAIIGRGKLKFTVAPVASSSESPSRAILTLDYHPRMQLGWPWDLTRVPKAPGRAIAAYALAGFTMVLIGWGLATTFYGHRIKLLEQQLNKAHVNQSKLPPTAARAIMAYTHRSDAPRDRGSEMAGLPPISFRLHSPAISLELALPQTREAGGYTAELKTFSGDQTLPTIRFLQARRTDAGSGVELLVPSDLLKADTYYTVHLHSLKSTDHFTFRVVAE